MAKKKTDNRGRPKKVTIKKVIKDLLPKEDIFDDTEAQMYDELLDVYISDFDPDELTSSDMDDIMNIAMNKVLSYRLLKDSKGNIGKQLDVAAALEKLDKRNEKLKESLSTRRRDRINPNDMKGFSIVDLAVAYDQEVQEKHARRIERLRKEEAKLSKKREGYEGNRYDREKE
jgi:hypothetical protein